LQPRLLLGAQLVDEGLQDRVLAPLAVDLEDVHSPAAVPPPAALLKVAAVEGEPAGQLLARGDGAVPQLDRAARVRGVQRVLEAGVGAVPDRQHEARLCGRRHRVEADDLASVSARAEPARPCAVVPLCGGRVP